MWVPAKQSDGLRRYGKWAGQPEGVKEDTSRCVAQVRDDYMNSYQCCRKRGHGIEGLFCKQHAKGAEVKGA